ncbi:MAG: NUMOD3 domain-containing DNA-binding protein [Candidatus Paceibacterota bacterium]|jgi:plasmid stability protein
MTQGICADPIRELKHRLKVSEALKGRPKSEEHRKRISEAKMGENNPNFGKPSPKRGTHLTEEHRRKLSEAKKGKRHSDATKEKLSAAMKGRSFTEETRRKMSEAKKGEKGPAWKGGISFEPYCPKFNNEFKERVRAFFGHKCVECGMSEEENGNKLSIHHVTYNKKVCCDGAVPLFVPLCNSCHSKTNHNREFWDYWFTEMIASQHGGKCYVEKVVG